MEAASPRTIVENFLRAVEAGDFDSAAGCLAASGFEYRSPITHFDNSAQFVADISRIGQILKRIEQRKFLVDGDDVCVLLDVVTTLPDLAVTRLAMFAEVRAGRIRRLEAFFDPRPYASLFQA